MFYYDEKLTKNAELGIINGVHAQVVIKYKSYSTLSDGIMVRCRISTGISGGFARILGNLT